MQVNVFILLISCDLITHGSLRGHLWTQCIVRSSKLLLIQLYTSHYEVIGNSRLVFKLAPERGVGRKWILFQLVLTVNLTQPRTVQKRESLLSWSVGLSLRDYLDG